MKILSLFSICALFLSLSACTSDSGDDGPTETPTGSLLIKASYVDSSPAIDAEVTLYGSQADYLDKTNPLTTGTTDEIGEALFTDLELQPYWYRVKKDGKSNDGSSFWTGVALEKDKTTEKLTQLN